MIDKFLEGQIVTFGQNNYKIDILRSKNIKGDEEWDISINGNFYPLNRLLSLITLYKQENSRLYKELLDKFSEYLI